MTAHSVVGGPKRPKPTRVLIVCDLLTESGNHRVTVRDISRSTAHIIGAKRVSAVDHRTDPTTTEGPAVRPGA